MMDKFTKRNKNRTKNCIYLKKEGLKKKVILYKELGKLNIDCLPKT